jgi:hypothetical protein
MTSGVYQFIPCITHLSNNTPSTDAFNALSAWSSSIAKRKFEVLQDEEKLLVAKLSWASDDTAAGPDLDKACSDFKIERSFKKQDTQ